MSIALSRLFAQKALGFVVAIAAGAAALLFAKLIASPFIGAPVLALAIGLVGSLLFPAPRLSEGYALAARQSLRIGVALLGIQISLAGTLSLGIPVVAIAAFASFLCVFTAVVFAPLFGMSRQLGLLIGIGTGICGASAIVAAAQVIRARRDETAVSLLIISVLGGIGVAATPFALEFVDEKVLGVWAGLSLHEVAHAIGAALLGGGVAAELGTTTKLIRVLCLAPALIALGLFERGQIPIAKDRPPIVPVFVFAFLALAAVNSVFYVPEVVKNSAWHASALLLAGSLVAIGLQTQWDALRSDFGRTLLHGTVVWVVLLVFTLVMILLFGLTTAL